MFFRGYCDQFNSCTYSLQLEQTSQKFLALSGIRLSHVMDILANQQKTSVSSFQY